MRVVIATDDKRNLNGHFALAKIFMFFEVTEDAHRLVNEIHFSPDGEQGLQCKRSGPFCIEERLAAIKGSDVIFVAAIGGPVADKVICSNVYPMVMNAPEEIEAAMSKLQAMLKGKHPLWLERILKHDLSLGA
ncbi:MAG: NifB/NifX family molybdenum-iron cluster-binding protein [Candidatus Omnitrophota bacterium]|jgi:nitrogen fixation protein NifX